MSYRKRGKEDKRYRKYQAKRTKKYYEKRRYKKGYFPKGHEIGNEDDEF